MHAVACGTMARSGLEPEPPPLSGGARPPRCLAWFLFIGTACAVRIMRGAYQRSTIELQAAWAAWRDSNPQPLDYKSNIGTPFAPRKARPPRHHPRQGTKTRRTGEIGARLVRFKMPESNRPGPVFGRAPNRWANLKIGTSCAPKMRVRTSDGRYVFFQKS